MAITSHGYFNEVIPGNIAARVFTFATNHRFWCYNQDAVRVTPVIGGTREIQISVGEFGSFGIYNSNNSVVTLQLDAPVSAGDQWWFVSATHTWDDGDSETTFELLHCGSVAQQPAGYTVDPGNTITMPLAYVPITFGDSDPGTPIDLRAMGTATGDVLVNSEQAISYLGYAGMSVWLGKTHYNRVLNSAGTNHSWSIDPGPWGKASGLVTSTAFAGGVGGWAFTGLGSVIRRDGNTVSGVLRLRRSSGGDIIVGPTGGVGDTLMCNISDAWRPSEPQSGLACTYIDQGGGNQQGSVTIDHLGDVKFTAGMPNRNLHVMPAGSWSISIPFTFIQE